MSVAFGCDWLAVSVTTPQSSLRSIGARQQIAEHLRNLWFEIGDHLIVAALLETTPEIKLAFVV